MTEELVDKIYEAVVRLHTQTLGYNNDYDSIDYFDYDEEVEEEEAQVSVATNSNKLFWFELKWALKETLLRISDGCKWSNINYGEC